MTVNDIYVIDPEYYKVYQKNKRQAYRLETLSFIIKLLFLMLFLVVSFFAYKIVEKNGYLDILGFMEPKKQTLVVDQASPNNYLEVPARQISSAEQGRVSSASSVTTQATAKPQHAAVQQVKEVPQEPSKSLSSEYLRQIEQELDQTL